MKTIVATLIVVGSITTTAFACEGDVKLPPIVFKGDNAYYRVCEGKRCKLERIRVECDSCPKGTKPFGGNSPYCVRDNPRSGWTEEMKAEQRRICNEGKRTPMGGCEEESR